MSREAYEKLWDFWLLYYLQFVGKCEQQIRKAKYYIYCCFYVFLKLCDIYIKSVWSSSLIHGVPGVVEIIYFTLVAYFIYCTWRDKRVVVFCCCVLYSSWRSSFVDSCARACTRPIRRTNEGQSWAGCQHGRSLKFDFYLFQKFLFRTIKLFAHVLFFAPTRRK